MKIEEIQEKVMIPNEQGIVKKRGIYFYSPSDFAKDHLFCVLWGGEYTCVPPYQIRRKGLELFLAFRILSGELYFEYEGKDFAAGEGDIILLDCRKVHYYYVKTLVSFQFFHFTGNCSQEYLELLYEKSGARFHYKSGTGAVFAEILEELSRPQPEEHRLSYLLHDLLGILAAKEPVSMDPCVAEAINYIQARYMEEISVEDIAEKASLSKYHFSRIFREQTGCSPHQYLISFRIRKARELIMETRLSIENIGLRCGFSSSSHFIRAFKKEMDFTPAAYRKYFEPDGFQKM